ncbi:MULTISPECIES: CidA/LrgA family protein [Ralstonia solanacearum species complex]|uniref:Effector of murein hydrolase protein n=3 Tax=Ralstonia solanacearum TaxID=305 RepID=A0ABF7RF56_RALSL|nr:CidA/LrgA family protein [Ralstonia solanacearum]ALF87171.1 Antiholin-like protein LrgA [Ralstonia solanacearum]ATI26712.1 CidA/LrgA family protein [Ralstonia solanacearum]EAP73210.1 Murein hydrolase exporter [Ralstonia solanacearum UW551]KEI32077.1 murein hydrolase transporter LrgA [Ralstonia solanacearum]KFX28523.1 murein hydrolase transporter LrgA [Ralstonia solanacearum]
MLQTFAILLTFQSVGELLSYSLHLPVPGPVIGMALLFCYLLADRGRILEVMQGTVKELLRHLTILFVPAGVGVMAQLHRIGQEWLPILVATVVSTWLAIATAALVTRALMRRMGDRDEPQGELAP